MLEGIRRRHKTYYLCALVLVCWSHSLKSTEHGLLVVEHISHILRAFILCRLAQGKREKSMIGERLTLQYLVQCHFPPKSATAPLR